MIANKAVPQLESLHQIYMTSSQLFGSAMLKTLVSKSPESKQVSKQLNRHIDAIKIMAGHCYSRYLMSELKKYAPYISETALSHIKKYEKIVTGIEANSIVGRVNIAANNIEKVCHALDQLSQEQANIVQFVQEKLIKSHVLPLGSVLNVGQIDKNAFLKPLIGEYILRTPVDIHKLVDTLCEDYGNTLELAIRANVENTPSKEVYNKTIDIQPMSSERHSSHGFDVYKVALNNQTYFVKQRLESKASNAITAQLNPSEPIFVHESYPQGTVFPNFSSSNERSITEVLEDKLLPDQLKKTLLKDILRMVHQFGISDMHDENIKVVLNEANSEKPYSFLPVDTEAMSYDFTQFDNPLKALEESAFIDSAVITDMKAIKRLVLSAMNDLAKESSIKPMPESMHEGSRAVLVKTALLVDLRAKLAIDDSRSISIAKKQLQTKIGNFLNTDSGSKLKNARTGLDNKAHIEALVGDMIAQLLEGIIPKSVYNKHGQISVAMQ